MPPETPELVIARGALWRVIDVERGAMCRGMRLRRVHPPPVGLERTLIEPFDHVHRVDRQRRPRVVRAHDACRAALAMVASARHWSTPAAVVTADIDVLGWQLAPAIALLVGSARRVLVADAVGLGKTVEAGIAIADVLARAPGARVLVLVPAGLRAQWRQELARHFALTAEVVDLSWLASHAQQLPPTVNPWAHIPLAIASLDFAKRGEVLPGPDGVVWSLVVVDEAHAAGAGTERGALVETVCRKAERVLLLSATPHNGDDARYAALERLGRLPGEPPVIVLRRERVEVARHAPTRSWHTLRVSLTPDEQRMHALLLRYVERVTREAPSSFADGARLAMQVLRKRAVSSAWALARTASRRQALLSTRPDHAVQTALWPADDVIADELADAVLGVPGLADARAEKAWLGAIADAARCAGRAESKPAVLRRWLRRVREPLLVFTEYRDSLVQLARTLGTGRTFALLHGGLSDAERARAIAEFTTGNASVMFATDAAAEGLNLHHRCRSLVMLDLPWTPTKLEQRIGRLDRMGQRRRVHAVALIARDTFEDEIARRLATRRRRADEALHRGAACSSAAADRRGIDARGLDAVASDLVTLRRAHRALARHHLSAASHSARGTSSGSRAAAVAESGLAQRCPWVGVVPPRRGRRAWAGAILIFEARLIHAGGTLIDCAPVPLHVDCDVPRLATHAAVRAFVTSLLDPVLPRLASIAETHVTGRWEQARQQHAAHSRITVLARQPLVSPTIRRRQADQPSLFGRYDTRGERARADVAAEGPWANSAATDSEMARFESSMRLAIVLLSPGPGSARRPDSPGSQPVFIDGSCAR